MCGRFASARKRAELLEEFRIERDRVTESLAPDYNVAPTKKVYAVLNRASRASEQDEDQRVARELRVVRWGLVPSWAKEPSIGSRMINARAETVASKPSFRGAFARRRCLLPADGFYEWMSVAENGKTRKQPYYIHRADGGPLAFAGLYELWRDKSQPDDHPDAWLWTTVIITTQAEDEVGQIHDRTPMIVDPGVWGEWLDPTNNETSALHALLTPAASTKLETYQVATDVNSVRNNGPGLIRPFQPAGAGGGSHGGPPGEDGGPAGRHRHRTTAPLTLF
ncbi:MAG TPA: SOS response-associated peptidase [Streptosporangiaceae bacterium]|jgi:putative SOS response-associated peptidase YedK